MRLPNEQSDLAVSGTRCDRGNAAGKAKAVGAERNIDRFSIRL